jgi:hypothetical protein
MLVPIFFAILEDDTSPEGISKCLIKFKSEILENYSMVPT